MSRILLFNKPFRVLSQFSADGDKRALAEFIDIKRVYPAGRLDYDSEGLMILTDDGRFQARLSDPRYRKFKTYLAQVEGDIDQEAVDRLSEGVELKDGMTLPALARKVAEPDWLWPRVPPIRERRNIPTSWVELQIRQGRNRQVRRMTAAVGFPTLRLLRTAIDRWQLGKLKPGQYQIIDNP